MSRINDDNKKFVHEIRTRHKAEPTERDSLLSSDNDTQQQSTGRTILDLAVPAAAALLIDPLMTLADTAFVGRYSSEGPSPLAGMGSAAALLTFSFYLFNFLCTATTPLVGAQRAAGNSAQARQIAGQALSLAIILGLTLALVLEIFSQPLLSAMGTSVTGDTANMYATQFLTIRALAAPAIFLIEASTGVLRGYLDTKTPIVVLVTANTVNLLLDVILIAVLGFGPLGAAIATTTAEWISAILFLAVLAGRLTLVESSPWTAQINKDAGMIITPTRSVPSWDQVQPLLVASSSIFLRSLVLQLSLSLAAAMAARSGTDTVAASSVAAHQIGIQLWLVCSFFCDSLAAASQGLVADAIGRQNSDAVREVSKTVFVYSVILGLVLALLLQTGGSTGILYSLFTTDDMVKQALSTVLPLIVIAQPLNALVFAADGVLQGASEFPFQAKAMLISGGTAVLTFVALQNGGTTETLVHVWIALIALQAMRGLTSLYKLVDTNGPINLLRR